MRNAPATLLPTRDRVWCRNFAVSAMCTETTIFLAIVSIAYQKSRAFCNIISLIINTIYKSFLMMKNIFTWDLSGIVFAPAVLYI
jgi:hypothetical protein